jgi:5-methylcytosine-specific restriction endonuclease McrA
MGKRYHDADWLRQRYHEEGMTQAEIAEECGVSPRAIRDWMKRHEIPRREMEGENHPLYGQERDESVKKSISETLTDREYPEKWRERLSQELRGNEIPETVRARISESLTGMTRPEETRQKMSQSTRGEANPQWEGGVDPYYGPGWSMARRKARERDEVCQNCGATTETARLEVHHIIPLRLFEQSESAERSEAHDLSNLVLLCRPCHMRAEHGDLNFESGIDAPEDESES